MSKVSRGQKGEEIVALTLNNIKCKHYVLNNVTFINNKSDMSHQIDHILIHPHGVFVIETKNYYGHIIVEPKANRWIRSIKGLMKQIPNPLLQNKSHAITVNKILKGQFEIIPVVVFVLNNAPYLPNDNAINLDSLLLFIDSYPYRKELTIKDMDDIKSTIEKECSDVSNKEHVTNIKILKVYKKEQEAEMSYAIEQGKCPWCDAKIIKKNNIFKCSKCSFSFKL